MGNIRLAAQSRTPHAAGWLRRAAGIAAANERAERALELAGLQARRRHIAGAASHEQRQLEIAMTLATDPQVLLLDEPLAGMGTAEAERMVALLLRLKKDHAMMLVEHDMDAVHAGRPPDGDGQRPGDRQRHAAAGARRPDVQSAYLGKSMPERLIDARGLHSLLRCQPPCAASTSTWTAARPSA